MKSWLARLARAFAGRGFGGAAPAPRSAADRLRAAAGDLAALGFVRRAQEFARLADQAALNRQDPEFYRGEAGRAEAIVASARHIRALP